MSALRNQSKPLLYGIAFLMVVFMGGGATIISYLYGTNNLPEGNSETCNPETYIACSDDDNFNILRQAFYQRYNNNRLFFHALANPFGINSQYSAIHKQLDTIFGDTITNFETIIF